MLLLKSQNSAASVLSRFLFDHLKTSHLGSHAQLLLRFLDFWTLRFDCCGRLFQKLHVAAFPCFLMVFVESKFVKMRLVLLQTSDNLILSSISISKNGNVFQTFPEMETRVLLRSLQ